MEEDTSPRSGEEQEPETPVEWRIDADASRVRLRELAAGKGPAREDGGMLIFTDEHGHQRRLPADRGQLTSEEIGAAARALSYELGAVEPSYARIAAVERLTEMRASGAITEQVYIREKRRLLGRD